MKGRRLNTRGLSILVSRFLPRAIRYYVYRSMVHIPDFPREACFEVAHTGEDVDAAFKLVHESYVEEKFAAPSESGRRATIYHALPTSKILVAKRGGRVIGAITVIKDNRFGLPVDEIIDISKLRSNGARIAEISSLAIHPEHRGASGAILFHLFKYMLLTSVNSYGISRFVIAFNPGRVALYEAILLFSLLNRKPIEKYGFANNAPAICATLNLSAASDRLYRVYGKKPMRKNLHKFFFGGLSEMERRNMRFPGASPSRDCTFALSPERMDFFFNKCTNLFQNINGDQRRLLKEIFPGDEYHRVIERRGFSNRN